MSGMYNQGFGAGAGGQPPPLPPRGIQPQGMPPHPGFIPPPPAYPNPNAGHPVMNQQLMQQIQQHQFAPAPMQNNFAGMPNFAEIQAMQQNAHNMAMNNPQMLQMILNHMQMQGGGGLLNQFMGDQK